MQRLAQQPDLLRALVLDPLKAPLRRSFEIPQRVADTRGKEASGGNLDSVGNATAKFTL
jgi:hypothetical protein